MGVQPGTQHTGRAQQVFTASVILDANDYTSMSVAILCQDNINEMYWQSFQAVTRKGNEMYTELATGA